MTTTVHRPKLLVILWCLSSSMLYALTVEAGTLCKDRRLSEQTEVGTDVSLSALCYPNGSVVYTWFSNDDDFVDRVQIEYQCYSNDTTETNPQIVIDWSNIDDGSRVADGIWDENTTCSFYGCYETRFFEKYWIQSTNCTPQFPAMITAGPADATAEYLSNVSLSCTARGIPVPDFTWTVDSGSGTVDVTESGQINIVTVPTGTPDEHMSILTLMSVQPSSANYTCHVSNLLGNDSSTAILNVQEIVPTTTAIVTTTRSLLDPSSTPTGSLPTESSPLGTGNFIAIGLGAFIAIFCAISITIFISFRCFRRVHNLSITNIEKKTYVHVYNYRPYHDPVDVNFQPVDAHSPPLSPSKSDPPETFQRLYCDEEADLKNVGNSCEEREHIIQTQVEQSNRVEEKDNSYCDPANSTISTHQLIVASPFEPTSGTELELRYVDRTMNPVQNSEGYVVEQLFNSDPGSHSMV